MPKTFFDISMSLDGFIAGPHVGPARGLGEGGERLHDWATETRGFKEAHGTSGGESGTDSDLLEEAFQRSGAHVMGRGMFGGGPGPWGNDTWGDWDGWWGDEPPFGNPVFVLTHHEREPLVKGDTTFTFVTDGIESAIAQAREAAGDRDVAIGGGADVIQQALRAGLVDEFTLHVVPVFLGRGTRLFEGLDPGQVGLECTRVIESPKVTHLGYRAAG